MPGAIPSGTQMICPRCKALRPFVNISAGGTQYRCGGCEWTYTLSTQAPTGTTSAAITTPATTLALTVASGGASFVNGMYLLVDVGSSAEVVQVNGTPTGTSIPVPSGFAKTHSSGAAIGQALATPTFGGVGEDAVVGAPGWGF